MAEHLTQPHSREDVDRVVHDFFEWAGDEVPYRMAFKHEDGQWFALALDYDITGRGDTLREAVDELFELVVVYLLAFFREGQPLSAAKRPVPLSLRARILVESLMSRVEHSINRKPPRSGTGNLSAPTSAVEHLVAC